VAGVVDKVRGLVERLLAVRIVESSVVLAAQAFLALFPLLIVVYAILPPGAASGLDDQVRKKFGLGGQSVDAMNALVVNRSDLRNGISVIGFILVIASATAFTRALQRVYQYAWGLPKLGLRGAWRTVIWLFAVVIYLGIAGWLVHLIPSSATVALINLLLGFGLWWWTSYLLLGGRVRWRVLAPGAILVAIAQFVVTLVSVVVLPRAVHSSESAYGPIGVVFAVESWFIVIAGVLVVGAALGAIMGLDEGRFGVWIRGTADPDGWRRVRHKPTA
ncbi:MAG TPA: YhjD/YihY/BrkB family envelope integrity protein, partial [Micromonosporaceae bacterium]